jgi:6-phosphogluconate dehydrogenase
MKIAVHGLGRMGMQIAKKLAVDPTHTVIAHNRSPEPVQEAAAAGAVATSTKQEVLDAFGGDQVVIWLMLPDEVAEAQLKEWLELVPAGSVIIDGGNSDFRRTREHAKLAQAKKVDFVDVGTSGGVWGMERGFCMMAGGDETGYRAITPVLDVLAAPSGSHAHFGPHGNGHYVKMVHNAIEYGMMESLAEGYRMLREGAYPQTDLAKAGDVWQHSSVITSWLNELCRDALRENPQLKGITGFVAENGEARWTLEVAKEKGIPMPAIQAAMDVRIASQAGGPESTDDAGGARNFATKMLAAMRNKFGGHALNTSGRE